MPAQHKSKGAAKEMDVHEEDRLIERAVSERAKEKKLKDPDAFREHIYDMVRELQTTFSKGDLVKSFEAILDKNYDPTVRRHFTARLYRSALEEKEYFIALSSLQLLKKKHMKEVGIDDADEFYKLAASDIALLLREDPKRTLKRLGFLSSRKLDRLKDMLRDEKPK